MICPPPLCDLGAQPLEVGCRINDWALLDDPATGVLSSQLARLRVTVEVGEARPPGV